MATLGYDLAGRINSVTDAAGTHTQTYIDGQRAVESHTSGVLQGESVTHSYDALGRLQTVALPGGKSISYTYNASGALAGVTTAGGATGSWSNFSPATGKAGNFALGSQSAGIVYDGLGRLLSYGSAAIAAINPYAYTYDADGHCSGSSTPNGVWTYVYDANGWLHSATAPGWKSFAYNFDEAGRPAGAVDYRPMVRLNNAVAEVMGSVTPGASLTINGTPEPVSAGGVFDVSFTPPPGGWQTYTVQGSIAGAGANGSAAAAADTFHVYVPPLRESLGYDASGNRGSDSRWSETWNALDQLTTVIESNPYSAATSTRLDCIYDVSGRRVQKQVSVGGQVTKRTTTLWDGWLPMMEIDYGALGQEIARRYYTWGPDVSGSLDGAAGIGGLIEIYEIKPTGATRSLPVQDGIGNVVGLVDETTGQSVATYQYGPFGEVVGVYGPRAESCPLRFQTKLYDEETGFYYFGKRYYDPKTQTWLSRDPERESGGINLYAYCNDNPVGNFDPIGLAAPPATPGSNPQQNTFDALLSFAEFIRGPARFANSILGLFEPSGDPLEYAGNLETVINGMTLDMPQIAAADGDPQMSAQVLQGFERQFTTPEGLGNLTFGLALGFAGPKVGDFIDAPITPQPSGLDMISAAKARVDWVTRQYGSARGGRVSPRGSGQPEGVGSARGGRVSPRGSVLTFDTS